jgi:hypothetical protein
MDGPASRVRQEHEPGTQIAGVGAARDATTGSDIAARAARACRASSVGSAASGLIRRPVVCPGLGLCGGLAGA